MRLFQSPWAYLGWLVLFAIQTWHDVRPHTHLAIKPWHPLFFGVEFAVADMFLIYVAIFVARMTSNRLERSALALVALTFAASALKALHFTALLHIALPTFRAVFLVCNMALALVAAIRFIQVLREPRLPGIFGHIPKQSE